MNVLHAADLHLGSRMLGLAPHDGAPVDALRDATLRAPESLVELALEEQVAFVLIAGDVYDRDRKDFDIAHLYVTHIRRPRHAGIPLVEMAGNQDAASRMTRQLPLPEGPRAKARDDGSVAGDRG